MKNIIFVLAVALLSACIVERPWYTGEFKFINNSGFDLKLIPNKPYHVVYNDTIYIPNDSTFTIPYSDDGYPISPFQVASLTIIFENQKSKTYFANDTDPRNPLYIEAYTAQKISETNILFEYILSVDNM
ncbi:MAG: hypothetical protein RIS47_89 [Bacteroidota bacterium]|jgi:hypothetical protein